MKYQQALQTILDKISDRSPQLLKIPNFIPAAIIIPIFNKNEEAHLLLTVRTDTVEHHKGQVSFPGGAREENDRDLRETALRETYEEVGIPPETVNIIGQLDDFPTISSFLVTPFIATIPYPYSHKINNAEVAEILEVPLELFLGKKAFEMKEKSVAGKTYPIYYYYFEHTVIWGVTGYIVNRFIELVFDYNPAPRSILSDPLNLEYLKENIRRKSSEN